MLEDLPAHLADVVAEGGTPRGELGEPAAYAAELRTAAGVSSVTKQPRRRGGRDRLRLADAEIGELLGYARLSDLVRSLQPAWWLLRAYLAVQLLTGVQARDGGDALVPQLGHSVGLGALGLLAACAFSIWLGRRPATRWTFPVSTLATVVLLWAAALTMQSVYTSASVEVGGSPTYYGELGDTSNITNIYPYGPDGKVLKNVRLLDQDGNPLTLEPQCTTPADSSGGPEVFPIECIGGTGSFEPESPLEPLPSVAPGTSAAVPGASSAPSATTPVTPSGSPTP